VCELSTLPFFFAAAATSSPRADDPGARLVTTFCRSESAATD
jgi:hypothetical protein